MKVFNQKKLAIFLLGLGTIPVIVCTILIGFKLDSFFLPLNPMIVMHSYVVVLCSFTAGIHWGVHLSKRTARSLYIISSALTVVMWASLLKVGSLLGLVLSVIAVFVLLIVEYELSRERVTTPWFWGMRRGTSVLVIIALGVVIILSY